MRRNLANSQLSGVSGCQTSLRSSGRSFFGCLFSKCCLYVLGSGICAWNNKCMSIHQFLGISSERATGTHFANRTHVNQRFLCRFLLISSAVALLLLHFRLLFLVFRLGLEFLMSTSHGKCTVEKDPEKSSHQNKLTHRGIAVIIQSPRSRERRAFAVSPELFEISKGYF